jgi:hypothetical protein
MSHFVQDPPDTAFHDRALASVDDLAVVVRDRVGDLSRRVVAHQVWVLFCRVLQRKSNKLRYLVFPA